MCRVCALESSSYNASIVSIIFYYLRVLPIDLENPEATRVAADKAKELFGTNVDILFNNAGGELNSVLDIVLHVILIL